MHRDLIVMSDALAGALLREREACLAADQEGMAILIDDAAEALLALLNAAVARGLVNAMPCEGGQPS